MLKLWRQWRDFVLDLLFPIECLNCRSEGDYLCEQCFQQLRFNNEKYLKQARANLKISHLKKIYIAGDYESSILHNLIIKYKYNFLSALGKTLARFLINFWQERVLQKGAWQDQILDDFKTNPPLIIPIPLAKTRERWRGFNQAEIIAREFCLYFNYELNLDLKRPQQQKPQATLNEVKRLENIKSAFVWQGKNLTGKNIILLDDVITTGATLNEAARILKIAGAKEIYALVLAKG